MTTALSETQLRAYTIIKDAGEFRGTACLGYEVFPNGSSHRTPQGMALAGGKVVNSLIKLGYVKQFSKKGDPLTYYSVTNKKLNN